MRLILDNKIQKAHGVCRIMIDIISKLDRNFLEIDSGISIQKAFELLGNPKVSTLIMIGEDRGEFHYLTGYIINKNIEKKKGCLF